MKDVAAGLQTVPAVPSTLLSRAKAYQPRTHLPLAPCSPSWCAAVVVRRALLQYDRAAAAKLDLAAVRADLTALMTDSQVGSWVGARRRGVAWGLCCPRSPSK